MFLPWKIKEEDHRILVSIVDRSGAVVAENVECTQARLIVKSANNFEGALSAMKQAFQLIKEGGFSHPMTEEFYDETLDDLNHYIEKMKGEI